MRRALIISLLAALLGCLAAPAAPIRPKRVKVPVQIEQAAQPDSFAGFADLTFLDTLNLRRGRILSAVDLRVPVFDLYDSRPLPQAPLPPSGQAALLDTAGMTLWVADALYADSLSRALRQNFMIAHPELVRYNERMLPEPPKRFRATVNPSKLIIVMEEIPRDTLAAKLVVVPPDERIEWINSFEGSMQFSQAYISPNWYQGGNNALSMIGRVAHNIKLNQQYHPRLMFENNTTYKLALASTPDDSLRRYSVTEDNFEITTKAGFRAFKYWFYSVSLNFKTQFLNSYPVNSPDMAAAFLSPGELNLGLGLTYDYAKPNKRFTINASISPLAWDLKTCINSHVDGANFGIQPGHKTLSRLGSSTEVKLFWALTRDITLNSRLFAFTQFDATQLDWENTIDFAINRFLSTRFYTYLRYDSTTPRSPDSRWHKWQFKEILSLGFAYKFSTL